MEDYANDLVFLMRACKEFFFMDETSSHCWERLSKVYMPKTDPFEMRFRSTRGRSVTVIGAISATTPKLIFSTADKTNTANVLAFLTKLRGEMKDPKNCVVVLDNHSAHKSNPVTEYARTEGFRLLYTPPTASHLNPIEI